MSKHKYIDNIENKLADLNTKVESKKPELSLSEKLAYASFVCGENIVFMFVVVFLFYQLDVVFGLSAISITFILLFAKIWDAINDPILGVMIQKTHPKFGKYKPWTFVGAILLPLLTVLLFLPIGNGDGGAGVFIYALVIYVCFGMAYTFTNVPVYSIATTMTKSTKGRQNLLFIGRAGASIGGIVFSIFGIYLFFVSPVMAAVVMGVLSFITLIAIARCKERSYEKEKKVVTIKEMGHALAKNPWQIKLNIVSFILFTLAFACGGVGIYLLQAYNFSDETLAQSWIMMIGMTAGSIVGIGMPFFFMWLRNKMKLSKRITMVLISVIWMIVFALVAFITVAVDFAPWAYILFAIPLSAYGMTWFCFVSQFNIDCVEWSDYHLDQRQEAIAFSIQTFGCKIGIAVAAVFTTILLGVTGYFAFMNDAHYEGDTGMGDWINGGGAKLLFFVVIGFNLFIGVFTIFVMLFVLTLKESEVKKMAASNLEKLQKRNQEFAEKEISENELDSENEIPVVSTLLEPESN